MRNMTLRWVDARYRSALKRGIRMFVITLFMLEPASGLMGTVLHHQPVDPNFGDSLIMSAMTGFGAFGWRAWLDPLPINTLSDTKKREPEDE